jgi:Uncharacterised protein family (UPF0158)
MSVVVSLQDIVDAMDFQSDDSVTYLNRETGEIAVVSEEDRHTANEKGVDVDELPERRRAGVLKARTVLTSADFVAVPDKFEIHEWSIMERFAISQADRATRADLLDALHRRPAFRKFTDAVRQLGLEREWLAFRLTAFEDIAKDWLEEHGIAYL